MDVIEANLCRISIMCVKLVVTRPKNPSPTEGVFRSRALFPPRLSLRLARGVRSQAEQP